MVLSIRRRLYESGSWSIEAVERIMEKMAARKLKDSPPRMYNIGLMGCRVIIPPTVKTTVPANSMVRSFRMRWTSSSTLELNGWGDKI